MDPLRPGDPRKIGRYVLSARLGAGGMGEVFFGRSPGGRPVAVKLIHPGYAADAEFRRRFRLEVEAARKVGGFHTAPVVDADADPDTGPPWMVTAYVLGPSLGQVLAEHGPLPIRTLRVLGAGLAEALEAIHAAGLIHRDLKPSNILLADDGPRVIDFGIARAADASGVTARVGTPGFMSPELLTGWPLTPASDVFAFGLVLAQAAGVRPFGEGAEQALNYRIVHHEPDLTGLDSELSNLVNSCLVKNPDDRPTPTQILDILTDHAVGDWLPPPIHTMITERAVSTSAGTSTQTPKFDVILNSPGPSTIQVIKTIRNLTHLELQPAKDRCDTAPSRILTGVDQSTAQSARQQLQQAGATATIIPTPTRPAPGSKTSWAPGGGGMAKTTPHPDLDIPGDHGVEFRESMPLDLVAWTFAAGVSTPFLGYIYFWIPPGVVRGYFGGFVLFCAFCFVAGSYFLLARKRVLIDRAGISVKGIWKKDRIPWHEILSVEINRPSPPAKSLSIVCTLKPDSSRITQTSKNVLTISFEEGLRGSPSAVSAALVRYSDGRYRAENSSQ